ncbi:MAG: uracil-DNA glycosylase [Pseudomonadota bacterium]
MVNEDDAGKREILLNDSWQRWLKPEFDQEYMRDLRQFLVSEKKAGKQIFPPSKLIFNALNSTHFDQVKVVILGQDPYHGPGQAHGLCFSVMPGVALPPSLQNIYKELQKDVDFVPPKHGCLTHWAEQGVLLLNAVLTVEAFKAGSHQGKGWEHFTDKIVSTLNEQQQNLVFILWGSYAQKKGNHIDRNKHLVLESVHPSPLSAHRGFFGNGHFSRANSWLKQHGKTTIDWQLPDISPAVYSPE